MVKPGQVYKDTDYGIQYHVLAVYNKHAWILVMSSVSGYKKDPQTYPIEWFEEGAPRFKLWRDGS